MVTRWETGDFVGWYGSLMLLFVDRCGWTVGAYYSIQLGLCHRWLTFFVEKV